MKTLTEIYITVFQLYLVPVSIQPPPSSNQYLTNFASSFYLYPCNPRFSEPSLILHNPYPLSLLGT